MCFTFLTPAYTFRLLPRRSKVSICYDHKRRNSITGHDLWLAAKCSLKHLVARYLSIFQCPCCHLLLLAYLHCLSTPHIIAKAPINRKRGVANPPRPVSCDRTPRVTQQTFRRRIRPSSLHHTTTSYTLDPIHSGLSLLNLRHHHDLAKTSELIRKKHKNGRLRRDVRGSTDLRFYQSATRARAGLMLVR